MRISCDSYNLTGNPMDVIASVTANGVVIFEMDSSGKTYHVNDSKNMLDMTSINMLDKVSWVLDLYKDTCFNNGILTEHGKDVVQRWLSIICEYLTSIN